MKKSKLLTTIIIAICVIALTGCPAEPEPNAECEHCKEYPAGSFKGVPAGLAYRMVKHYKTNHWDVLHNLDQKKYDARSVWFSLDSLKKFIYDLEQNVCNNNKKCKSSVKADELGIRFYYAEYPDETEWTYLDGDKDPTSISHKQEYQNLHTVVIAPTYNNGSYNVDFDPRFFTNSNGSCKPMSMQEVFNKLGVPEDKILDSINGPLATLPAFMLSTDCKTSMKNKGSLIPPPPTSGGQGAIKGNGAVLFDLMEGAPLPNY